MIKLQAVRVRNLRALADTDFIDIKPITLLVGRNSSGKSTFARIFPLLRQSAEAVRRTPVLWYGRLTDFGTISDARRREANSEGIEFSYRLSFSQRDLVRSVNDFEKRLLFFSHYIDSFHGRDKEFSGEASDYMDISVEVRPGKNGDTSVRKVSIDAYMNHMEILFDERNAVELVRINNTIIKLPQNLLSVVDLGQLIPQIGLYLRDDLNHWKTRSKGTDYLVRQLHDYISSYLVHGNTTDLKIYEIVSQISLGRDQDLLKELRSVKGPQSWKASLKSMTVDSAGFAALRDRVFAAFIPMLLQRANDALTSKMKSVKYLEPLRATAQRFYRRQELAVNEIDSRGENMAMFLDSLSWQEKRDFQAWCKSEIGFSVEAAREGGHVSIRIQPEGDSVATNLADTGFGFSQFLPIAAQIWSSSFRYKNSALVSKDSDSLLVIEQPELHLHPAFQARLADLFAIACGSSSGDAGLSSIIAETHSSQLVHRLGALVAEGKVSRSDVQVVLFEKQESNKNAEVRIAEFDEEGVLINWPFGFLEASA